MTEDVGIYVNILIKAVVCVTQYKMCGADWCIYYARPIPTLSPSLTFGFLLKKA